MNFIGKDIKISVYLVLVKKLSSHKTVKFLQLSLYIAFKRDILGAKASTWCKILLPNESY